MTSAIDISLQVLKITHVNIHGHKPYTFQPSVAATYIR